MKLNLKNLVITAKQVEFEVPFCKGMKVKLAYVNKPLLNKLREDSLIQKFDLETAAPYKELDADKYVRNYAKEVIVGWTGFTYGHLSTLMLIDETGINKEDVIEFDTDTAVFLLQNSPTFDTWVVSMAKQLDNFRN